MPDLNRTTYVINGQSITIANDLHNVIITVTDRDGVSASLSTDSETAHDIANNLHLQAVCAEASK